MNTIPTVSQITDNTFALAVAVFRECIASLSPDDKQDVLSLIPQLLNGDDDDEKKSAAEAISEILHRPKSQLVSLESLEGCEEDLASWTAFVSKRIREAREAAGLTQAELSQQSGLPQSHISRLEQGKHSPTARTLERIATALKLPHSHFDPSA